MAFVFRLLGVVVVLALAVLSAWVGSSMASWLGGPRWVAVATALVLSPGLALLWELGSARRRRARAKKRRVALPVTLALRSTVLAGVFLGVLLAWWPGQMFLALSQRGDWFLDDAGPEWERVRPWTRAAAGSLERLWRASIPDPYRQWEGEAPKLAEAPRAAQVTRVPLEELPRRPQASVPEDSKAPEAPDAPEVAKAAEEPGPVARDPDGGRQPELLCAEMEDGSKVCIEREEPPEYVERAPAPVAKPAPAAPKVDRGREPVTPGARATSGFTWPLPHTVHPAVARITAADEASVRVLGETLKLYSQPGADRLKAIHDWLAVRVAYDAEGYQRRVFPSQRPEDVLERRTAVCAGYSLLFEALAVAAGEEAVYLTGLANGLGGFEAHAWNAARVAGGWVLIDVTWDAGYVRPTESAWTYVPHYRTAWLFTPPEVFADSHLPTDPRWQLQEVPRTAAEALAKPRLLPGFFTTGLRLKKPAGAVTEEARGPYAIEVDNPLRRSVIALACHGAARGKDGCRPCEGGGRGAERLLCPLDAAGGWELRLFASPDEYTPRHEQVATATVQVR